MAAPVALDSQSELGLFTIVVLSPHSPLIAHLTHVDVTKYPQTQASLWRINFLQGRVGLANGDVRLVLGPDLSASGVSLSAPS